MPYEIDRHNQLCMRRADAAIAAARRLGGASSDCGCFLKFPAAGNFAGNFSKNVRQETGKTNDYGTYFNPEFKKQGILREFWRRHPRRIRVVLHSDGTPERIRTPDGMAGIAPRLIAPE